MRFSNTGSSFSTAEAYATTKTWTLSSGAGTKTVYVQFKDAAGNWSTLPITDTIVLDTTAPTISSRTATADHEPCQHDHLDHQRARDLAGRLRAHHQLRLDHAARSRARHLAQRSAERPLPEHDVQLSRSLARCGRKRTRQRQQQVHDGRRRYDSADGAIDQSSGRDADERGERVVDGDVQRERDGGGRVRTLPW